MSTLQIQKSILLDASIERVWQAISDAKQFGSWFGAEWDGPFVTNTIMNGRIVPTQVDSEVARLQEPHRGKPFCITIDEIDPLKRFRFRWHPFAIDPSYDYSRDPMTSVVFELSPLDPQTLLTITESGFDQLPLARQASAFQANDGGWSHQTKLIEKYLMQTA